MKLVTACSGIDAIAYAGLLLDIDIVGQIEIDEFCNKILELRYPGAKRCKDIFDVRGDEFGTIRRSVPATFSCRKTKRNCRRALYLA